MKAIMKLFLEACGLAFTVLGFFGFFFAAMSADMNPWSVTFRFMLIFTVGVGGGLICLKLSEV